LSVQLNPCVAICLETWAQPTEVSFASTASGGNPTWRVVVA
jgi:hypothetical protein